MAISRVARPGLTTSYLPGDTSVPLIADTIGDLLIKRAREYPTRTALVGNRHDTPHITSRLTYVELLDEAVRVATALRTLVQPGEFVGLWAPNVIEWPIIEYGAALAGNPLVALDPALGAAQLEYAVEHSGVRVLMYAERNRDDDLGAVVADIRSNHPDVVSVSLSETDRWMAPAPDSDVLAFVPTDSELPAMLQYTSGTTGRPKGVLLRHKSLVNVAKLTMEAAGITPGAVSVNPLPMFHTASCVIGTLGPMWLGGTAVLIKRFSPAAVLDAIRKEQPDVLFYVPAILDAVVREQESLATPPPPLAMALGGASDVPQTLIERTERQFGALVINVFGQTELSPVLTATRPDDSRVDRTRTVGRPLPQVDCKVVDPLTGDIVPIGTVGEVCARGYQQLIEYLHDPQATADTVDRDGFVHTGDLGSMDERGYLSISGRVKDVIIRGGENIAPTAVENAISEHPDVVSVAVVGLPDSRLGEIVAAVITLNALESPDLVTDLKVFLQERIPRYMIPSRWFVADLLPVTPAGKVRKFKVREQLSAQVHEVAHDAPLREIAPEE